jgi:putative nucleotidyltransferase with HDIG domain
MGFVAVEQLKEGMVLESDVVNFNSRLLLKKGGTIDSKHIRMFKMWGIGEVDVEGDFQVDADSAPEDDPERIKQVADQIKTLFKFNDLDHPLMKQLFVLSVIHRSKQPEVKPYDPSRDTQDCLPEAEETADVCNKIKKSYIKLPEIPSNVYELNEVIADPFTSAKDIAQMVSKSPSLASLLLRIVNSAFYGFPSKIGSISRAVALIGSKEISSLALGISTMHVFNEIPKKIIDVRAFFKHSLACGVIARILAAHLNFSHTEQLFVSGLLHDIGRAVVFKYFAKQSHAMLAHAHAFGLLLHDVELDFLKCRHTQIGRDLFRKWRLPYRIENCTDTHHTPSKAQEPGRAAVVHLADICVHALGLGASGEIFVPPLDEAAVGQLGFMPAMLKTVAWQALHQLDFMTTAFQEQG